MKKVNNIVDIKEKYWTDEFGVQYSMDKTCLIKAPDVLEEYVIRDGTIKICEFAFDECKKLARINILDSVTSIGDNAFSYCENLKEIVIPASVQKIGEGTFEFCNNLRHISVAPNNNVYDSRNNCNAIIHTSTNTLIAGSMNTIIPEGIQTLGPTAFTGRRGIESLTIPEGVTKVGFYSFFCCELKFLILPTTIKEISDWMLTVGNAIYVPDGMQEYYAEKLPQHKDIIRIKNGKECI